MRLLIIIICIAFYIAFVDLIAALMATQQREVPKELEIWSLVAPIGLIAFQFRPGLAGAKRLFQSILLTAIALVPWALVYWFT